MRICQGLVSYYLFWDFMVSCICTIATLNNYSGLDKPMHKVVSYDYSNRLYGERYFFALKPMLKGFK